jgi:hypothetical protein
VKVLVLSTCLVAVPVPAFAQLFGIDLTFQSVAGSVSITGAGSSSATLNFGTVSAFEPVGVDVVRTSTATDYTIATQFGVRVTKGVLVLSPNYTLRSRFTVAQPLTWKVDSVTMSTSFATIATSQPYVTPLPHSLAFIVPLSSAAGTVNMNIEVLAVAN